MNLSFIIPLIMSLLFCVSCSSSSPASNKTKKAKAELAPPSTVKEYIQRLPGVVVTNTGVRYRNDNAQFVLDGRLVSYQVLLSMVNVASIKSVKLLNNLTDIKRYTNSNTTAIVEIRTQ